MKKKEKVIQKKNIDPSNIERNCLNISKRTNVVLSPRLTVRHKNSLLLLIGTTTNKLERRE